MDEKQLLRPPGTGRTSRPSGIRPAMHPGGFVQGLLLAGIAFMVGGCGPDEGLETSRMRGDGAFARGDYEDALAEYRLSMREGSGIEAALRTAHTYAVLGRVDEARTLYDQAVREDSAHADQAVSDFVSRAREAFAAGDRYGGASAMETAAHFRPGIVVEDLVLPMARHYSNSGQHGRAQPLYLRVLGSQRRDPDIVFEAARAHQEIGDCERALEFFDDFVELARHRERETRWHVGSCAFQLAQELIEQDGFEEAVSRALAERADTVGGADAAGGAEAVGEEPSSGTGASDPGEEPADVLRRVIGYLDLVIEIEEPRAALPEVYFRKAGVLARIGECEAAVEAYLMVPEVDVSGSGALGAQALLRVDEIRFREGEDPC